MHLKRRCCLKPILHLSLQICWTGIIEARRLSLIIAHLFIPNPVMKMLFMTMICFESLCANISFQPYRSGIINFTTVLSLSAQIIIAFVN